MKLSGCGLSWWRPLKFGEENGLAGVVTALVGSSIDEVGGGTG